MCVCATDEDLARRLQAEEDLAEYTRLPTKTSERIHRSASPCPAPASSNHRPVGLVGIQPGSVAVTVIHKCATAPASLREIMQEEQAIEASKHDFVSVIQVPFTLEY